MDATTSAFIAGRTGASDFGTDGFFIGRTSSDGINTDGFQLSHTSVTSSAIVTDGTDLLSGTVQGVIHDDTQGLRLYEPVFYARGGGAGADVILDAAADTATLTAGEIHSVTIWGGGGGGGAGADSSSNSGNNANAGGSGGTSTVVLTGATGFNGTRTFNAAGGAGGAGGSGQGSGAGGQGEGSAFGLGGAGGAFQQAFEGGNQDSNFTGNPGSAPAANAFAAGGGGGAPGSHVRQGGQTGAPGVGGSAASPVTVTYDLTNANNDGILTLNARGAAGAQGNNNNNFSGDNNPGGDGGGGRAGAASVSGVLDGYTSSTLADLSPPGTPYFTDGNLTAWSTNNSGNISGGTNGAWVMCSASGNGFNNSIAQQNGVDFTVNGGGGWIQGALRQGNTSTFSFGVTGETFIIAGGGNAQAGAGTIYAWVPPNGQLTRAARPNGMGSINKTRHRAV